MANDNIRKAGCKKLKKRQKELQRSKEMQKNLSKELNAGLSAKQIQEKYKLSRATVYRAIKKLKNQTDDDQCTEVTSQMSIPTEKSEEAKCSESERVRQMKANFMRLHNEELSIKEIAQKYDVIPGTVYYHLQAIADANGVTRDSLLKIVQAPKIRNASKKNEGGFPKKNENMAEIVEQLMTAFSGMQETVNSMIELVDSVIQGEENEHE